ncbi:unnamed protein product, partial [Polarella glacialis]
MHIDMVIQVCNPVLGCDPVPFSWPPCLEAPTAALPVHPEAVPLHQSSFGPLLCLRALCLQSPTGIAIVASKAQLHFSCCADKSSMAGIGAGLQNTIFVLPNNLAMVGAPQVCSGHDSNVGGALEEQGPEAQERAKAGLMQRRRFWANRKSCSGGFKTWRSAKRHRVAAKHWIANLDNQHQARTELLTSGYHQSRCADDEIIEASAASRLEEEEELLEHEEYEGRSNTEACVRPGGSKPAVHAAFYLWYGNPEVDGRWIHWNHKVLPHWEPN